MRGQDGSIDEEFACAQTILTQTKRGQKHDIMPVGQRPPPRQIACSSAPRCRCEQVPWPQRHAGEHAGPHDVSEYGSVNAGSPAHPVTA
jgi:hypothetical protein